MKDQFTQLNLLLKRLGIVLLIYTICRVLFYWFNASLFPITVGGFFKILVFGLRFDVSAIIYSNLLFITLHVIPLPQRDNLWYQRLLKAVFYIPNTIALFLSVADFEYFRYSLKRSSSDVTGFYFDFMNLFAQFLKDFWYLLLILGGLLVLMELLYRKTSLSKGSVKYNYPLQFLLMIVVSGLVFLGARGGWQMRPITPITSLQYVDATLAPLVTNTPFHFYFSLTQKGVDLKDYFSDEELKGKFNFCHTNDTAHLAVTFPFSRENTNVVIIVLESYSQEFIGSYGAQKSYTPFLDSLSKYSLVYKNMFANGTRSVEGIPAICASMPALMDECFIYSPYQTNKIDGLGTVLKKIGYSTAFFHGGNNGTFNFDSFAKLAGFDDYYGRNEYNNEADYDGNWGIFDEPFFQFSALKMDAIKFPFCTVLFSLSSHHPFTIPKDFETQVDDVEDDFLKSMRYTDHALRKFFETTSKMPWYENTLFVITADHRGPAFDNYYHTWTGRYEIPLIVFKPNSGLLGEIDFPVQQIDILPGVLDYLNYPYRFCSFGESIFRNPQHRYIYQYLSGNTQISDGKYVLHFDGNRTTAFYEYKKHHPLEPDIQGMMPDDQNRLEDRLKAILQVHNAVMVENRLRQ